jgi:hypothetical protein
MAENYKKENLVEETQNLFNDYSKNGLYRLKKTGSFV